jgi:hypothetical protein
LNSTIRAAGQLVASPSRDAVIPGNQNNNGGEMVTRQFVEKTLKCEAGQYPSLLEQRFPHVLEKIVKLWHSRDAEPYFNDLLLTNGQGGGRFGRDGFPDNAWQEILELKMHYDKCRPWQSRPSV